MTTDVPLEGRVLGHLLRRPEDLDRVALDPSIFSVDLHRAIAELLMAVRPELPGAFLTLAQEAGKLKEVGGSAYIADLESTRPVQSYPAAIERLRKLRRANGLQMGLMEAAVKASNLQVEVAMKEADEAIVTARAEAETRNTSPIGAAVSRWVTHRIAQESGQGPQYPRTGYALLDRSFGGLRPGSLWILSGRSGCRKSWLMLALAHRMARAGLKPGIVSVEDPESVWAERVALMEAPDATVKGLVVGAERCQGLDIVLAEDRDGSPEQILRSCQALVEAGCGVLFVDYVQAATIDADVRRYDKAMANVARSVKRLGARAGIPAVVGSQLTTDRRDEFKEPTAYDLRESRDLLQVAEVITTLWKPRADEEAGDAPVLGRVAKLKWGRAGLGFRLRIDRGAVVDIDRGHVTESKRDEYEVAKSSWMD